MVTRFLELGDFRVVTRLNILGGFPVLARFLHMDESQDVTRLVLVGDFSL